MSGHNIKTPPALSKAESYETWLKELQIWELFTEIPAEKRGPAVFLTLEGKAREAVLELEIAKLAGKDGIKNVIEKLDILFKRDQDQTEYEAYEQFEIFKRPSGMYQRLYY